MTVRGQHPRRRTTPTPPTINAGDCLLPLAGGSFALVDVDVYERERQWMWRRNPVSGAVSRSDRRGREVFLNSVVLPAPAGHRTDHVNEWALDCRRENLRIVPESHALATIRHALGFTQYRGVRLKCGKYLARCSGEHLGSFENPETAAQAYDDSARGKFGALAVLNFPKRGERAATGGVA